VSASAAANMKRMLSAALSGPDGPLLLKDEAPGGLLQQKQAGLAIKNPPKKTQIKKPTKNVFYCFFGIVLNF
jgi:hypothetical protein